MLNGYDVYDMYEQWLKSKMCRKICENIVEYLIDNAYYTK